MIDWRLAKSLAQLRTQLDALHPNRNKAWDGTKGDERHASIVSDHNPDSRGIVCAMDITHDPPHECNAALIAERLRASKDGRIKYLIFDHFILRSYDKPGIPRWTWASYTNTDFPHDHHLHISIIGELADATSEWSLGKLTGIVEIDETFIGGKERNKHEKDKLHTGRGPVGKTAVLGLRERGGRTKAMPIEGTDLASIQNEIYKHVAVGSTVYTDEHGGYEGLDGLFFKHDTVNHGAGEFVRGEAHTNGIESAWAVLKRGVIGVYHQISEKHNWPVRERVLLPAE